MSPFIISLTVNVILTLALVSLIFRPKVIKWYRKRKITAERRKVAAVRKIVLEYLEELSK